MIAPSKIRAVAERYYEENIEFRTFLKEHADCDELDAQFLELHNELFNDHDCCKCNNCCKAYAITFSDSDIDAVSKYLGLQRDAFVSEYLDESDYDEDGYKTKEQPCVFLCDDGKCRIQECKPESCKGFPFTDQPDRLGSMLGVIDFAEECPVVFEILKRLKGIYGFEWR